MKVGDLVQVEKCDFVVRCGCWFCENNSNCVGVVLEHVELTRWLVMFDAGEWQVHQNQTGVINESR
jgi:hypothetical protein